MKEKEIERLTELKKIENDIYKSDSNIKYICGIDEAGRGPLAGPVVVASVIMPKDSIPFWLHLIYLFRLLYFHLQCLFHMRLLLL